MSSATLPTSDRVRQIAILVASVDATAARQLLLHLPTEMAKRVRAMASQLGPISAEEKRSILSEFQKSAGQGSGQANSASPDNRADSRSVDNSGTQRTLATDVAFESRLESLTPQAPPELEQANHDSTAPSWTQLSTEALVRFVKVERVAVTAVVISQLAPKKAVDVLQRLPRDVNHAVLKRLSNLQDIDPDATAAIDEHLAERLNDYQHRIESEQENSRRLQAVLAAAPQDLQQEWRQAIEGVDEAPVKPTPRPALVASHGRSVSATIAELYGDSVITTADSSTLGRSNLGGPNQEVTSKRGGTASATAPSSRSPSAIGSSTIPAVTTETSLPADLQATSSSQRLASEPAPSGENPDVLAFPTRSSSQRGVQMDRSYLQVEFEQILQMPHQQLAVLLSDTDSQTVLLALAGATPDFMRSFTRKLESADAQALKKRIREIGPINLRDVDEAQRRIVDRAAAMQSSRSTDGRAAA